MTKVSALHRRPLSFGVVGSVDPLGDFHLAACVAGDGHDRSPHFGRPCAASIRPRSHSISVRIVISVRIAVVWIRIRRIIWVSVVWIAIRIRGNRRDKPAKAKEEARSSTIEVTSETGMKAWVETGMKTPRMTTNAAEQLRTP